MCRNGAEPLVRAARLLLVTGALALPSGGPAAAQAVPSSTETGVELTVPVQQILQQLQEQWVAWGNAFYQGSGERSDAIVVDLLTMSRQLGMFHLPDLSLSAAARAVEAARAGESEKAALALAAAERLDPGRPETAFAAAATAFHEGRYPAAASRQAAGYARLFSLPLERTLFLQDALLWALCALLLAGGLSVAVQMATKGGALYHDLSAGLGRRLGRGTGRVLALALLLLPLPLPYGPLWLLLYWSVLLWGYTSRSERCVLVALWLLLGFTPLLVGEQRRRVAVALSPPAQAMWSVEAGRLYGGLFSDVGVLKSMLPDSPAVEHFLADLHRRLGQWDVARTLYRRVLEREPENTSALLNLGAYYFYRGDFSSAREHFQQAADADPGSAAAQFNLSQTLSESYAFDESRRILERAKELDGPRVDRWLKLADQQRVVVADGGVARIPEIRRELLALRAGRDGPSPRLELLRRWLSVAVAVGLAVLAAALHLARRQRGYTEPPLDLRVGHGRRDRWLRLLLPGAAAAEAGEGVRSYLAVLVPTALLTLPFVDRLGYRQPWGYDPGGTLPWTIAVIGLLTYLGARLRWELQNDV